MRNYALALGLSALSFTFPAVHVAQACEGHDQQAQVKPISVEELARAIAAKQAVAVDANDTTTRAKYGIIPGATLLSHYERYDVSKELPADKAQALVFYCGGPKCTSAPKAADKAVKAGYTNVRWLEAGIKGWTAAGQPAKSPSA